MLTFISIVIVAIAAVFLIYMVHTEYGRVKYNFESLEKVDLPYISIDIQGKKFNMVTDSAASVSIIKKEALKELQFENSPRKINLAAITNDSITSSVVSVPITLNNEEIKIDFVVYDGIDIADFEKKYGITLHGILGVEFFKKTKGKLDFGKQIVTLS
jgi:hypothetical protein